MRYLTIDANGKTLQKNDKLRDFRGDDWTYQSTTHPRKVFVTAKDDPNGPDSWPNMASREFYASVFNLGIWDTNAQEWSFEPDWPAQQINMVEDQLKAQS